jgi:hypothetical protein
VARHPKLRVPWKSSFAKASEDNLRCFAAQVGGCTRARTSDPLIKSQLLYQLSYAPTVPGRARNITTGDRPVHRGHPPFWGPISGTQISPFRIRESRCTRTERISPNPIITAIIEVPPNEISGSGTPTTGISPITIAVLMKT